MLLPLTRLVVPHHQTRYQRHRLQGSAEEGQAVAPGRRHGNDQAAVVAHISGPGSGAPALLCAEMSGTVLAGRKSSMDCVPCKCQWGASTRERALERSDKGQAIGAGEEGHVHLKRFSNTHTQVVEMVRWKRTNTDRWLRPNATSTNMATVTKSPPHSHRRAGLLQYFPQLRADLMHRC